jgi:hypothetical protein
MAYTPIRIPAHVPPTVRIIVEHALDPRLHDVHCMLRLPMPALELLAGCNYAIADALFGVIEGVSAVLFPRGEDPKSGFVKCISEHYPLEAKGNARSVRDQAGPLYDDFRNTMQHCLGLGLGKFVKGRRARLERKYAHVVFRDRRSMSEQDIVDIESGVTGLAKLDRPTLEELDGRLYLSVEAFYVGTRLLIESILSDVKIADQAESDLSKWFGIEPPPEANVTMAEVTAPAVTSGPIFSGE